MKTLRLMVLVTAAPMIMSGCASGGGGDEASQDGWGASGAEFAQGLKGFLSGLAGAATGQCPTCGSGSQASASTQPQSTASSAPVFADGVDVSVRVSKQMGVAQDVGQPSAIGLQAESTYSETRSIRVFTATVWPSASGIGYFVPNGGTGFAAGRGIETLWRTTTGWNESPSSTMFTSTPGTVALVANPYASGWNYQSFGVWASRQDDGTDRANGMSFGSATTATPGGAVPNAGSATFYGKLAGLYVSRGGVGSVAAADIRVQANFSQRSLGFSSSSTVTTRTPSTTAQVTTAPHLNLSGTLSYAPGSGAFSGAVATADGAMTGTSNGQFYGPAAQELGGVFALKSATTVETFVGAYGAKR
ncbi:MAG TPA: transferrin-binding protein-like solute binding protein [Burkholderiales bacterium]|nr:transferrin-binding protein-like solute binding protein [Burkholderiales bacterium]